MARRLGIKWILLILGMTYLCVWTTIQGNRLDNLKNENLQLLLRDKNEKIAEQKEEIAKRNRLIESLYEDLTDTIDGVDNAPVSASHDAITGYLDSRK